jgi:hypothetical protein
MAGVRNFGMGCTEIGAQITELLFVAKIGPWVEKFL